MDKSEQNKNSSEDYRALDANDPLSSYRELFDIQDPETIYLDGNSLGRLPLKTREILNNVVNYQWGNRLIRGWNEGWYELTMHLGDKLAPIIGAEEGEVIFSDSTSHNLFKLLYGGLKFKEGRKRVISDIYNFPSDIYLMQGVKELFNNRHEIILTGDPDSFAPDMEKLMDEINEDTALVSLSHVLFKSAYMYDMKKITRRAHEAGALVLWDLSHSVGSVTVDLGAAKADLAVGCSYKYLNGGPGAPAFLFVKKELQEQIESPVWGWFGEKEPFKFGLNYKPAKGIRKYLAGTPSVISLAAIEPALDIILEAGMDRIRNKSINQTNCLLSLTKDHLYPLGFISGSPMIAEKRGSHVAIRHAEGYRICKAMMDPHIEGYNVIPDFREPDIIRLGISPLYTTYEEIFLAVKLIERIVREKLYTKYSNKRDAVT